jgi:hypothetical protein
MPSGSHETSDRSDEETEDVELNVDSSVLETVDDNVPEHTCAGRNDSDAVDIIDDAVDIIDDAVDITDDAVDITDDAVDITDDAVDITNDVESVSGGDGDGGDDEEEEVDVPMHRRTNCVLVRF